MLDVEGREKVFEIATGVAGCPFVDRCTAEFKAAGARKAQGEERFLASVPSPDFVGSRYRGLVIIGGNPGLAHKSVHEANDAMMWKLQREIATGDRTAFDKLMAFLPKSMAHWPQMVDAKSRALLRYDIEDVAYVDIVKCASRPGGGDTSSLFRNTGILSRCWMTHTKPLLELLQPSHIIALWKPIIPVLEKLGFRLMGLDSGAHSGARHLTREEKYREVVPVFDRYYGRG